MSSTCNSSALIAPCFTRFTTGEAVGLALDLEAGLISLLAVMVFLSLVVRNVIRNYKNPPPGGWSLLRTHVDMYILFLLLFESIHGLSATMSAKWLHEGELYCSKYCTVQGALRNAGATGVALVTLVIAIHTFLVIFFKWIPPRSLVIPLAVSFSISAFLIAYISYELSAPRPHDQQFYAPSPYWCWIGPKHEAARVWGEYLWLWLTSFMSILLYVPLYFCVKGNLSYHPESRWKINISRRPVPRDSGAAMQTHAAKVANMDAMCMLYYPVAYTLLVLPDSIVRFMSQSWEAQGRRLPFAPNVMGSTLFGLSGVVNVVLFMMTRPNLLLFRPSPSPRLPTSQRSKGSVSRVPASDWENEEYISFPPSIGHSVETLAIGPRRPPPSWRNFEMYGRPISNKQR